VAGVIVLGVAAYVGSRVWAQGGGAAQSTAPAAQTHPTKVALINLAKVINSYDKWKAFKEEYKREYTRVFEDPVKPLKTQMESLDKEIKDPKTPPDRRDAATIEMKSLDRKVQDIAEQAKNTLGKKEADQFVQLYKEVRDAVKACATYYSIDVVMHYNDAFEEKDMDTPPNVARKMGHAGLMPIYVEKSSDLSDTVILFLNRAYADQQKSGVRPASGSYQTPPGGKP
jgi:Skp family chaperone for outer membrane proteins